MVASFNRRRAEALSTRSIPQLFLDRCAATPESVALRYKDFGIYQEVTWRAYREQVEAFLAALVELGLEPGDRVAIMGDPCFEYLVADMAVMCGGAVSYGIYSTCSEKEVEYQINNAGAKFFISENQEYVDKILNLEKRPPSVRKIIVCDTRAMFMYDDPHIVSFAEMIRRGREALVGRREFLEQRANAVRPTDLAIIVYTSGTTGPPKGAMHNHASLMWGLANAYLEGFPELNQEGGHRGVAHLPLAHLIERSSTIYLPLIADLVPHIGDAVEELGRTLCEVEPDFLIGGPRIYEKVAAQVHIGIQRSTAFKRAAYAAAMRIGRRYRGRGWEGRRPDLATAWLYRLAWWTVFRPLLKTIGMSKIRSAQCAGAPVVPKIQELWQIWGINIRNLYGITEGAMVLCQTGDFPKPGDAGVPIFPSEVKLGQDGEILVRGSGLFMGYWQNEAATREMVPDGWLHTGDIAQITPEGRYRIIDRKKDIMITSGGKNIAPSEIENLLKASPYISEAVLFGDSRKFVSALIEIDFSTVSEWARQYGILYTSFTSLSSHPKVNELIASEIEAANRELARVEQVKKFMIIPKELDPEEGDTTPTRKIKRKHLYHMFHDLVEGMYADSAALLV